MLFHARFWLMLLLTVATGSCGARVGHEEQDNSPKVIQLSGWNGGKQEVADTAHVTRSASEQPIGPSAHSTHATEDMPCDEEQLAHSCAMDDFLLALNRESELRRMEFQQFGICSSGTPDLQILHLVQSLDQKQTQGCTSHKSCGYFLVDIWDAEKEGEMTLTLTFPRHAQPTNPASVTLLFSVDSIKGDGLRVKFNSHSIHPNTQTVCISEATRFMVLTAGQSRAHVHLKLSITIETWKDENINISNCEGVCGFPLTSSNNHAILLNIHLQSGQSVNRTVCCVPVDFDDLWVIELETNISLKTNAVATKCECR